MVDGRLGLISEGITFVMKQMAAGIVAFAPVFNCELNAFREVLLTQQSEEVDSEEDIEVDGYHDGDGDDDDEEFIDCNDEENVSSNGRNNKVDFVVVALEKLIVDSLEPVVDKEVQSGVSCWRLPSEISQGRYKGHTGSNACSLISLLIEYAFYKNNTRIPSQQSALSDNIIRVICGCMEFGNRVYDMCRHSLPSRYLSIQEAASVLDTWLDCAVGNAFPVRLQDPHEMSTICGQLSSAGNSQEHSFSFLIMNGKTSFFLISKNKVLYVDTHNHPPHGAIVIVSDSVHMAEFCKSVWDLQGYSENTFGNLAFVDFAN